MFTFDEGIALLYVNIYSQSKVTLKSIYRTYGSLLVNDLIPFADKG